VPMVVLPEPVVPIIITITAASCGKFGNHRSKKVWLGDLGAVSRTLISSRVFWIVPPSK
jgi:hypothetical protein